MYCVQQLIKLYKVYRKYPRVNLKDKLFTLPTCWLGRVAISCNTRHSVCTVRIYALIIKEFHMTYVSQDDYTGFHQLTYTDYNVKSKILSLHRPPVERNLTIFSKKSAHITQLRRLVRLGNASNYTMIKSGWSS